MKKNAAVFTAIVVAILVATYSIVRAQTNPAPPAAGQMVNRIPEYDPEDLREAKVLTRAVLKNNPA